MADNEEMNKLLETWERLDTGCKCSQCNRIRGMVEDKNRAGE